MSDISKMNGVQDGLQRILSEFESREELFLEAALFDALQNLRQEIGGGALYKPAGDRGLHLKNLEDILHDPCVIQVLGQSICHYLSVLLSDSRGWNLRNDICHGITPASDFNARMCDRMLHVLLVLAQIRSGPTSS